MHRVAYVACSICLVLAACSSETTFTDAAVGDDVPEIDANTEPDPDATPSGTVHVTAFARNGGLPDARVANVEVLVYGLDGTLRDRDQTDSSGEAVLDVISGDTVTAIYDVLADQDVFLTTFVGVEPGDDLRFGDAQGPVTTGATTGSMTVTWPALSGTAVNAYLVTSCGTSYPAVSATSMSVPQYDYCATNPFSVLLYATGSTGDLVQWGVLHDVAFTDLGTAPIPALDGPATFTVNVTGLAPEISWYEVYAFSAVDDSTTYVHYPYFAYGTPTGGAFSGSMQWATGVDGAIVNEYLYRNGNFGSQNARHRLAQGVSTWTTPSAPLPWLSDTVLTSVEARVVQWFQTGTALYDGGTVRLAWSTSTGTPTAGANLGSGSSTQYEWVLIIPPGLTMLAFPALPEELEAYAPAIDANLQTSVELFDAADIADYDAVRGTPEWILSCIDCTPSGAATFPSVRTSSTGSGGVKVVRRAGVRSPLGPSSLR